MYIGINQKVAPIKFGFLTRPNSKKSFERAVGLSCTNWGGYYSPIIPLYKKLSLSYIKDFGISVTTEEYYKNTFDNFNVDVIIYDDSLEQSLVNRISGGRRIFSMNNLEDELVRGFPTFGIDIFQLTNCLIQNEFKYSRNDSVKLILPTYNKSDLLLKVRQGYLNEKIHSELHSHLKGRPFYESPRITTKTKIVNNGEASNIGLYGVSMFKLNVGYEQHWYNESAIYFLRKDNLNDIQNFWNLRAVGWNIVPVPIDKLNEEHYQSLTDDFLEWFLRIKENQTFLMVNYIVSHDIKKQDHEKINEFLNDRANKTRSKIRFGHFSWKPRYWEDRMTLDADKTVCCFLYSSRNYDHHETKDGQLQFDADPLPFSLDDEGFKDNLYKIDIEMSIHDDSAIKAGAISDITTSDWNEIVETFDSSKWHLTSNNVNYYIRSGDNRVRFKIPDAKDFFKSYFSRKGKTLMIGSNGKLAEEVLKNIGGIRGTYIFNKPEKLEILSSFENGKIIEHRSLSANIKKNFKTKDNDYVERMIQTLLNNKIIEFGTKLECTICEQKSFFLPNELNLEVTCKECRNSFSIPSARPSNIKSAYRGIGPFSKNNKVGGLMTVFLCLQFYQSALVRSFGGMSSLCGFELMNKDSTLQEIDLGSLIKTGRDNNDSAELLLAECKTFINFELKDFQRMKSLGDSFPGSILVFATLNESFNKFEKSELRKLVEYFRTGHGHRPRNSILLLTKSELMPEDYDGGLDVYDAEIKPYHRYQGFVSSLSEMTVKHHLSIKTWGEIFEEKWVKEHQTEKK